MGRIAYRGRLIDFVIFLAILAAAVAVIRGGALILFASEETPRELRVITKPLPKEYSEALKPGDTLYDAITKRAIGKAKSIERIYTTDGYISFEITVDATGVPRGGALRTPDIYLEISEVNGV